MATTQKNFCLIKSGGANYLNFPPLWEKLCGFPRPPLRENHEPRNTAARGLHFFFVKTLFLVVKTSKDTGRKKNVWILVFIITRGPESLAYPTPLNEAANLDPKNGTKPATQKNTGHARFSKYPAERYLSLMVSPACPLSLRYNRYLPTALSTDGAKRHGRHGARAEKSTCRKTAQKRLL